MRLKANYFLQHPSDFAALGKDAGKNLSRSYFDIVNGNFRQVVTTQFSGHGLLS